jgi:uncharacterized OB-fold protein
MARFGHPSLSDSYLPAGLPAPAPDRDGVDAGFWEAARRHQLAIQRCRSCGAFQSPAEWVCHHCHSRDLAWETVAGRGRIFSWIRAHHAAHPALRQSLPYLVVLIEIDEAPGVRIIGNLLGDPQQEVAIGGPVEAVFEDHAGADEADTAAGAGAAPAGAYTLVQWRAV